MTLTIFTSHNPMSKKAYYDIIQPKFLSWEFIEPYTTKEPPFGALGLVVYLRTYSRYIPELKRRESWWETVLRVVEYSLSLYNYKHVSPEIKNPELVKEGQELFDYMFNLKVFSSGRTLWVGGTQAATGDGASQMNCSFAPIDSIKSYVDMVHVLLLGCGAGFSVEEKYISQLPTFNKQVEVIHEEYNQLPKEAREEETYTKSSFGVVSIEVGDSRLAWEQAVESFLTAFSHRDTTLIKINYDSVRPAGERLKKMGGRSSGWQPLMQMFEELANIIKSSFEGRLNSVDAMDVANSLAKMVVVGGVRRSSQISLGDVNDKEFLDAKTNLWTDESKSRFRSTRVMSNNSVHLWSKPEKEILRQIFYTMRDLGEPGVFCAENANKRRPGYSGTNPSLRKGTKVLTSTGIFPIEQLEGKSFIVNTLNNQRAEALCFLSGKDKPLYKITLQGNHQYFATAEHKWPVIQEDGSVLKKCTTELEAFDRLPIIKNNSLNYGGQGTRDEGICMGYVMGDGWLTYRKDGKLQIGVHCSKEKYPYFGELITNVLGINLYPTLEEEYEGTASNSVIRSKFEQYGFTSKSLLPTAIWSTCSDDFIKGFVDGLFSTDGHFSLTDKRVSLTSSKESLLRDLSELLGFYGIKSTISIKEVSDASFPNGKTYDRTYTRGVLRIAGKENLLHFHKIFTFSHKEKAKVLDEICENLAVQQKVYYPSCIPILSVQETELKEDVWDITVLDSSHTFQIPHCITGNCGEILLSERNFCNLTEVNLLSFVNKDNSFNYKDFYQALRLATRMGSRITNLTMWDKTWDENQKRERLLGVSITGQVEAFDKLGWGSTIKPTTLNRIKYAFHRLAYLVDSRSGKVMPPASPEQFEKYYYYKDSRIKNLLDDAHKIVRGEADKYHEEMGIPKSLLTTTVKPSGTLSNLPCVSSGAHRPYAPYYLRRIRVSKNDPVAQALYTLGIPCVPENGQGEDLHADDCNTWVFTFPVKTNAPIRSIDERAVDQLERYKQLMQYYVEHNVSFTCSVDTHEWDEVVDWLYKEDNWDNFVGISFLPRFDSESSPYPNMPYVAISKEEYDRRISKMPQYTQQQLLDLINKYEVEEEEYDLGSDCQGSCPVR